LSSVQKSWKGISLSSSGQYQTANNITTDGLIYISSDYGKTWSSDNIYIDSIRQTSKNWYLTTVSASGRYQNACENTGSIYISSDYGYTWIARPSPPGSFSYLESSFNGNTIYAAENNGLLYTSSDYGESWTPYLTDTNRSWSSLTSSYDGTMLVATVNGGNIYLSSQWQLQIALSAYTPANPAHWVTPPTTIIDAIDRMAALLYTLNSNTAIP
jgi:photosystem II stability/assembly factor-like uncharacterized protein